MKSKKQKEISRSKDVTPFFKKEEANDSFDPYQKDSDTIGNTVVQRFSSPEHKKLGDTTGLMIDIGEGVQLSFGDIVALAGDEFGSPEELYNATKTTEGRARIRAHLQHAEISPDKAALLPQPKDDAEKKAQQGAAEIAYYKLAMDNISHFFGGGTAFDNWFMQHTKAVTLAMKAGLYNDLSLMNQANLMEAFGAHFLTDSFSAGHIRTPRTEINDYYVNEFAPKVYDNLVKSLTSRMVKEIFKQVDEQTIMNELAFLLGPAVGVGVDVHIKKKISNEINAKLNAAIASLGGRDQAIMYLGKILGGVVSLTMHDKENEKGLWVISKAHPEAWQAFGDSNLEKNPLHKELITKAVKTSLNDLKLAYETGVEQSQESFNLIDEKYLPSTVYFAFNSTNVNATDRDTINALADYLNYHPTTSVTLVGHTDPLGTDDYNDNLGIERAVNIGSILLSKSVDPSRVLIQSHGEKSLVTRNPARYKLNRRVEIFYQSQMAIDQRSADQIAYDNVVTKVQDKIGPPYAAQDHFPYELQQSLPDPAKSNPQLPEWKWGSMSESLKTDLNNTLKGYIGGFREKALNSESLNDITVDDYTVKPRPIAEKIFNELSDDPMKFLGQNLGQDAN